MTDLKYKLIISHVDQEREKFRLLMPDLYFKHYPEQIFSTMTSQLMESSEW